MLQRPRLAALTIALTIALVAAACGGDSGSDDEADDTSASETAADAPATPTPDAPDTLPPPTDVPVDEIDVSGLGPVVDGQADDDFDRCSVFTAETLSGLLGEMWEFAPGTPKETIACTWQAGEGEDLGFVLIAMGQADAEFDARMGDSAAGAVAGAVDIGDEFYDVTGSTYGPGVAFTQDDVGVLVHVIWGTPNTTSRVAVEREAELRIADNLSFRLPSAE
jgi:hypothetical protein